MSEAALVISHDSGGAKHVPSSFEGSISPNFYCRGWNAKRAKYCKAPAGLGTDHLGEGRCKFHGGNQLTTHGLNRRYNLKSPRIAELIAKHEGDENPLDISAEISLLRSLAEDYVNRYDANLDALSAWHAQRRLNPDQMSAMYALIDEYEAITERTEVQSELLSLARDAVKHLGEDIARPSTMPDIADASRIVSEITKAVERVFNMRAKNAITYDQLRRFLFATERIIESRIRAAIAAPTEADVLLEKIGEEIRGIRP